MNLVSIRHKSLPEFDYNKDPWLVNLSNVTIPHNVQDLLRLGEKFSNPFFENKQSQVLEIIKNVKNSITKIPEELRYEFRLKVVNQTKHFLSKQQKNTEIDRYIIDLYKETDLFLKGNSNILVTKAD